MRMTLLFLLLLRICQTSCQSRASVTVSPSSFHFFEYDNMSVSCEQFQPGEWTVWRYTTDSSEPVLSQCGSGWGTQTSSTCNIKTVKLTDGGVYWCESKHRDSSNVVNITVTAVTGGSVMLQSPVRPVMKGDNVTLLCKRRSSPSNRPADFYKDGSLIRTEPAGHMTIYNFSKSDEGAYKCVISGHGESPSSWLLMEDDSQPASFTVLPNSPQQFEYENLSLSCGDNSRSDGWGVVRATRTTTSGDRLVLQSCGARWGTPTHFGCILQTVKKPDSGVYWCESPARRRSNSVNITVYDSLVILQSPVRPVMEGDNVTLLCKTKTPSSNLRADFYKDGSLIRTEPAGHMTIRHVSWSDEGLYRCHISSHGESPSSWLFVKDLHGSDPSTADPPLTVLGVIRHLVVLSPYCVSTALMVSLCRHKHKGKDPPVSLTMSPPTGDDEGLDQPYDDVTADVTTEHHF